MTGGSILDSLEEQQIDISTLANASDVSRLTFAETNMYFQFTFGVNENMLYYLLKFRGMLLDILDILRSSGNIRRVSVGEIRVPERALTDAKRIFYDLSIFPRPVICPYSTCIFEVFMDVERPWRIPGALRVMCPVCQILKNFTSHHYRTDIQVKLVAIGKDVTGDVYFQDDIERLATLKSRYSGLEDPSEIGGVLNKLVKWLPLFGIDTDNLLLRKYQRKELSNFLGEKGKEYPEKVRFI